MSHSSHGLTTGGGEDFVCATECSNWRVGNLPFLHGSEIGKNKKKRWEKWRGRRGHLSMSSDLSKTGPHLALASVNPICNGSYSQYIKMSSRLRKKRRKRKEELEHVQVSFYFFTASHWKRWTNAQRLPTMQRPVLVYCTAVWCAMGKRDGPKRSSSLWEREKKKERKESAHHVTVRGGVGRKVGGGEVPELVNFRF